MEEHLSPLAVTHLLQHTLRSLCIHENSQWVYAVFWRILPRNYPPPKWDGQGAYDRSRGNRRNWILVWEDGFCNFAASAAAEMSSGECPGGSSSVYGNCDLQHYQGLQPELFFKMSHEIYNYGEGLIGKVAADHSHKWIYKEPSDQEINFLSAWHNTADSYPRTWEAQFQSGIKTIALIAVREGVVQLGSVHKVIEDLSYVVMLRKKFSYIESIPGVLLPHPSSSGYPFINNVSPSDTWHFAVPPSAHQHQLYHQMLGHHQQPPPPPPLPMKITPSMSSLEALLSKLPSVVPPQPPGGGYYPLQQGTAAKEENDDQNEEFRVGPHGDHHHHMVGESSHSRVMMMYHDNDDDNDHNNHDYRSDINIYNRNDDYCRENKVSRFLSENY